MGSALGPYAIAPSQQGEGGNRGESDLGEIGSNTNAIKSGCRYNAVKPFAAFGIMIKFSDFSCSLTAAIIIASFYGMSESLGGTLDVGYAAEILSGTVQEIRHTELLSKRQSL